MTDRSHQETGQIIIGLLGVGAGRDRRLRKVLGERVDLPGGEGFGFHIRFLQALVMWEECPRFVTA